MFGLSRRSRSVLAIAISAALVGGASFSAMAQTAPAKDAPAAAAKPAAAVPVFVVVDIERVRRESVAGKSIAAEAEKYNKTFADENQKDEAPLRANEQELQKQRGTLPPDQFAAKARTFEQKFGEVQRTEMKRHQALDTSYNTALNKLQQSIMEVAREVAQAHNADAVLYAQVLVFFNTGWDITNEVLDQVNKRVSKIDFPPPKIVADQPGTTGPADAPLAGGSQQKQLQSAQPQLKLPPQ